jgi:NAD(P)-dependent dehydrogenase (short-subunit alcohol dehydrogenase family)
MQINGISAIVTGGASGIGEACARQLAAAGAKVLIADVNDEKGNALATEIGGAFAHVDVTNTNDIIAAVETAMEMGPLRALVNSAGIGAALPGAKEAAKERRAEQRDAIKTLAQQEGFNNKQSLELANAAIGMSGKYGEFRESDLTRKQEKFLTEFREKQANLRNAANIAGGITQSNISAGATRFSATEGGKREILAATREAGRYYDALTEESPSLKRLKATDPLGYTKAKMQYIRDYVYGPQ